MIFSNNHADILRPYKFKFNNNNFSFITKYLTDEYEEFLQNKKWYQAFKTKFLLSAKSDDTKFNRFIDLFNKKFTKFNYHIGNEKKIFLRKFENKYYDATTSEQMHRLFINIGNDNMVIKYKTLRQLDADVIEDGEIILEPKEMVLVKPHTIAMIENSSKHTFIFIEMYNTNYEYDDYILNFKQTGGVKEKKKQKQVRKPRTKP